MVSVYDLKQSFQGLLRPLTNKLAANGITANQVTVLAMSLSIVYGLWIYAFPLSSVPLLLLGPFLFVRMALNAIDGMLAREHNMKSHTGAYLNEFGDVISDTALYLPLAGLYMFNDWLVVAFVILLLLSEFAGVLAHQIGVARRYDGPMGKSDRAFVMGAMCFIIGLGLTGMWVHIIMIAVNLLLAFTIYNRISKALKGVNDV